MKIICIKDQNHLYSKSQSFVESKMSHIYSSHSSIGNNVGDITSIPLTAVQMQTFILYI
jgi:ubiquinone biosynthesis protein COQ9